MRRLLFIIISLFFLVDRTYGVSYPKELIPLAESIGLEAITFSMIPDPRYSLGGNGLPFLFDVLTKNPTNNRMLPPHSVIFSCRKLKKGIKKSNTYSIFNYQYYLILAIEDEKKSKKNYIHYHILDVFSNTWEYIELLNIYTGALGYDKDLSYFTYNNSRKKGPKNIFPSKENGFLSIISYSENGFIVLYFYKKEWLIYRQSYR